MCIKIWK